MKAERRDVGHRLANPRDPVVLDALTRTCTDCDQEPDQWCVGIALDSPTRGRRRRRIHFARCQFAPADVMKAGVR
jgi:hypothetical protein